MTPLLGTGYTISSVSFLSRVMTLSSRSEETEIGSKLVRNFGVYFYRRCCPTQSRYLRLFLSSTGSGLQTSSGIPIPKHGSSAPPPFPEGLGVNSICFDTGLTVGSKIYKLRTDSSRGKVGHNWLPSFHLFFFTFNRW